MRNRVTSRRAVILLASAFYFWLAGSAATEASTCPVVVPKPFRFLQAHGTEKIYKDKQTETLLLIKCFEANESRDQVTEKLSAEFQITNYSASNFSYSFEKDGVATRTFLFFRSQVLQVSLLSARTPIEEKRAYNFAVKIADQMP